MKKMFYISEALFALLLSSAVLFAIWGGGRGLHSWPLLLPCSALLMIAASRIKSGRTLCLQAAMCHFLFIGLCAFSIYAEYSYSQIVALQNFIEIFAVAAISAGLLALNVLYYVQRGRNQKQLSD
jgi:hypothetical protein